MIEFIGGFITSFALTLFALLVGYSLGKNQSPVTPDVKKQMNQIFKRVVAPLTPKPTDVGPVERPTVKQNYYRDHPEEAEMDGYMTEQFDDLNNK